MKNRTLQFFIGILTGIITPFIASELLRVTLYSYVTWETMRELSYQVYLPIIKLGAFANIIPFLIFNKLNWESAMRGMIVITLIFAFTVLAIIYVL
jgi:hypothetical protein